MPRRVTEDFVRWYELMLSRTGNMPAALPAKLERDRQLLHAIHELDSLWDVINRHRRISRRRFIVQADPKFRRAFEDYEARWKSLIDAHWEEQRRMVDLALDKTTLTAADLTLLDENATGSPDATHSVGSVDENAADQQPTPERYDWEFDPDRDSAAELIEYVEGFLQVEIDSGFRDSHTAMCSQAAGAMKWMRETVGLDLGEIESRWKEIPPIVVPKHVSDRHGIEDPYSLFGYLDQVRLAYMIGADLAAIAMCRAATEILIRFHYNQDDKTDLKTLVRSTQQKREFFFLQNYNLASKIEEANDILHFNKGDIKHRRRSQALVREWIRVLREMIDRVPSRS
jgi:hypothetical protein